MFPTKHTTLSAEFKSGSEDVVRFFRFLIGTKPDKVRFGKLRKMQLEFLKFGTEGCSVIHRLTSDEHGLLLEMEGIDISSAVISFGKTADMVVQISTNGRLWFRIRKGRTSFTWSEFIDSSGIGMAMDRFRDEFPEHTEG